MTTKELDRLQALCDRATAGPWHTEDVGEPPKRRWVVDAQYRCVAGGTAGGIGPRAFDADFIAAARTALPALISEVRRLQHYEDWARKVAKLPCCNDCADTKTCTKKPEWGAVCAINCPLWRGPQPAKEDA